jgi:hypothetical protein
LVVLGDLTAALIVAVFLALSFAHLLRSDRRPAVFDVLFALAALAALAGALGYAFARLPTGRCYGRWASRRYLDCSPS